MRKVFLEDLPKRSKTINWKASVGYNLKFIYDDLNGYLKILNYNPKTRNLLINYNNIEHTVRTDTILKCNLCFVLNIHTKEYKYNIGDIIETKTGKIQLLEQIRIQSKKYTKRGYKYICLIDGNIDEISEYHILEGKGCNVCGHNKILKGYNDLWTTNPDIAKFLKYPVRGYEISSGSGIEEIYVCPECNFEKNIKTYSIVANGFSCPKCGDGISYPNKFMFNMLEQLDIKFQTEYNPKWCKYLFKGTLKQGRYDFHFKLNNEEYIIEMDGEWHNKDNTKSGQTKEESIWIDNIKDELANKHKIKVIRINCIKSGLEYIKNSILHSELVNVFNLNNINWLKCHEYACNNLVKEVCMLWNKNNKTSNISKLLKLSRCTVIKYLRSGNDLNWCNYNPIYEISINGKNACDNVKKKIICLNTLEIFNSITSACYKYNLNISHVVACCKQNNTRHSVGKHPSTGEKLRWMYYEDYIKDKNNKAS